MFVCFRHIKVERLAGKKSLKCLQKNALFFFYSYIKVQREKRFDIRGKNQIMLSTFLDFRFIHTSGNKLFSCFTL